MPLASDSLPIIIEVEIWDLCLPVAIILSLLAWEDVQMKNGLSLAQKLHGSYHILFFSNKTHYLI